MNKLTAITKSAPANLEEIKAYELEHSIKLPNEYRDFLATYNFITVSETFYKADGNEFWVSNFYPFDKNYLPSIQSTWRNLNEFFQKEYFAFADDGSGWQFVVCLKEQSYGKIFFCRMDEPLENALTFVSNSFFDFIAGLKLAPEIVSDSDKAVSNSEPLIFSGQAKKAFRSGIRHFKPLARKYKMQILFDENYEYGAAKIFNNNCTIDLSIDRYSSYIDIYFINPLNEKSYHYGLTLNQRGVYKFEKPISCDHLDGSQRIKLRLKIASFIMNKYCSDILSGDFSNISESQN